MPNAAKPIADRVCARSAADLPVAVHSFKVAEISFFDTLNLARSIAEALALAGVGPEVLPYAQTAAAALARSWRDGRPVPMNSADLDAVRNLVDLHEAQRAVAGRVEFEKAVWAVCGRG